MYMEPRMCPMGEEKSLVHHLLERMIMRVCMLYLYMKRHGIDINCHDIVCTCMVCVATCTHYKYQILYCLWNDYIVLNCIMPSPK